MNYHIEWEQDAVEALDRLDTSIVQRLIVRIYWLSKNIDDINPQALIKNLKGYFKLRVGDYRVIYSIMREEKLIIIEDIGHRRDIYKTR
jgi:mRNA interferase RelE/StbE